MPKPQPTLPIDTADRPAVALAEPTRRTDRTAQPDAWRPDLTVARVMTSPSLPRPDPPPPSDGDGLAAVQAISRTKITPPLLRSETLTRPRLIDWLRERSGQRLILVTAEAGYGKTTLLADYGRQAPVPLLWFKLDGVVVGPGRSRRPLRDQRSRQRQVATAPWSH